MGLRSFFFVNTRQPTAATSALDGFAAGDDNRAAAFVTIQSLATFPVASGVVTLAWKVMQGFGDWGDSRFVPLVVAALIGGFLTLWSITDPSSTMNTRDIVGAVFIAAVNVLFLYAAAVGIDTSLASGSDGEEAWRRALAV